MEWITYDLKWKTLWPKEKLLILSNFFFCHYVFKNLSAAVASERVKVKYISAQCLKNPVSQSL